MLSVVKIVNNTRGWYEAGGTVRQRIAAGCSRGGYGGVLKSEEPPEGGSCQHSAYP